MSVPPGEVTLLSKGANEINGTRKNTRDGYPQENDLEPTNEGIPAKTVLAEVL